MKKDAKSLEQPLHIPPGFDPKQYPHYDLQSSIYSLLLSALTLSTQPALRSEVSDLLAERGLPVTLDGSVDPDAVIAAAQRDKKRRGGRVGFVLVEGPGALRTGAPVAESDIRAALSSLR